MNEHNKEKYFDDTIVLNNILSDNSEDIITIYSKDLHSQYLDKNNSYKVSPDGKIISSGLVSDLIQNSKEMFVKELINYGFEKIPDNFTEIELENILKYSISKIGKEITCAKIETYSVKKAENGNLEIILLIFNGNTIPLNLGKFPLKLKDGNNKVVLADFIDLKLEVNTKKIGICCLNIRKELLKEETMDLNTWTLTFEV